jgi:hypothetical protein
MRAEAFPVGETNAVKLSPTVVRTIFLVAVAAALTAGFLANNPTAAALAVQHDGAALTRLMRFMALIKAGMALAAASAVFWRLGVPARWPWLVAYGLSGVAMAAGPGLIWGMVHVGLGALLLHGGLLATIFLLWRDKAVGTRLEALLAARQRRG